MTGKVLPSPTSMRILAPVLTPTPGMDVRTFKRGCLDGLGVGAGAVPADDLGAGMLGEAGRERLRGAVGQYVHDPAGLDVDQHVP